jgi:hypothetical protein
VQKGASREIKPLSPQDHPDIAAALEVFDEDNELRVEHNRPFEMLLDPRVTPTR